MRLLPFVFCVACSGSTTESADTEADTDTDTDADTDTDDTAPATGSITGTLVTYDGSSPSGVEVQACVIVCYSTDTDATGAYSFSGLADGEYKLDGLGESVDGKDYGRIRVRASLSGGGEYVAPAPLFLPQVYGPESITSTGTYTFGPVRWTVDPSTLTLPFGYEADQFEAGVVDGANIGPFWSVTPALAVAFGPLGTEVSSGFEVAVTSTLVAGTYDVYAVGDYGQLEGPVGTATADGAEITLTASPSILSWLLLVPQT